MIDDKTKNKFLKELEKSGNVFLSCLKVGIDRSTHYRWLDADKEYKERAERCLHRGRENNCDIAEHALLLNVKEKKMDAIKYVLSHNSPSYKPNKNSNVVIVHKKELPAPVEQIRTLEDLLDNYANNDPEYNLNLRKKLSENGKEIPNKPDGTPIKLDELRGYEGYITDWQNAQEKEKQKELNKAYIELGILPGPTDTENLKSSTDKPQVAPQENQKPSDKSDLSSSSQDTKPDNNS